MKLIDSKGRLFGKFSILDLGAAFVILLVAMGIFVFPGTSGKGSIAQVKTQPVEVDAIVRGLSVRDPKTLMADFRANPTTNIVIRNQPAGTIEILKVEPLPRTVFVPQPDGSVKALPDPRPEAAYSQDMIVTLGGKAEITETGAVIGSQKVKIGTLIELEGKDYNFNTSVIAVRIGES
jgi:hypothetical protein